ncbi:MAG: 4Fe-4S dicluster domain-containing protein [Planctomycetes bacterium]|nr:4Fe-4S dicluster domain-containing protein [Planctomycetota bacterium]
MPQYGWTIDLTKCVGCHGCAVACKAENNTAPQTAPLVVRNARAVAVNYRRVLYRWAGAYPTPTLTFVTSACNHCANPACMPACPVGAISKRAADGIVLIDYDRCIGCKYCLWACPYGAPQFNETTEKVEKCTFCVQRIDAGLKPACVTTCAGRALNFVTNFDSGQSGQSAPAGFAPANHTRPSVLFTM